MSLDPSEFGTADIEIAAVIHSRKKLGEKTRKKKIMIQTEKYKMPDYGMTNYGLGYPKKKPYDITL